MRICIIHQYFKTPQTGGAIRSYYIANYLKNLGHEVTVVTARNNRAYNIDKSLGYDVHYLPVYYENHLSFLSRIHAFFLFVWKSKRLLKKLGRFDINYVITTPLSTGFIANYALRKFGTPYIFEVGDLWPEAPIQLGVIKSPLIIRIARYYEKKFYNNAKSVVALSPDIKENINALVPNKRVDVITNFSDPKLFETTGNTPKELKGKFIISYIGTVGLANHLEYLIDCAKSVKYEKVHFIIAGDGAHYSRVKELAEINGINNITFYDKVDKAGVAKILSYTDAVYVSFDKAPILSTGSPNKFFDGLAAGKLIIINFKGWIKTFIEENECGFSYDPANKDEFKTKLLPFLNNPELLNQAKNNSKSMSAEFTPEKQLRNIDSIITR